MDASLLAVLNDPERLLVAQTEPAELAPLDEDAAIELEARIRRARNKYVSQYRRNAAARVAEQGGRGRARPENRRAAMKAEAFEEALSRISRRVATLARQSAAELRAERIAAARAARQGRGPAGRGAEPTTGRKGPAVSGEPTGDRPEVLDSPVALLTVGQAKGLEFDRVVLVDPAGILAQSPAGGHDLYVALTRATHRLTVVYDGHLPAPLHRLAAGT